MLSFESRQIIGGRGMFRAIITIILALLVVVATGAQTAVTVDVTGGQIRGAVQPDGGAVFRGIPYAAPPTGDRRWREPLPVEPWTGARPAFVFDAICPQRLADGELGFNRVKATSEDCLFLNVWTPQWPPASARPVMVWIHGGGNFGGSGSAAVSDGERLSRRGVVVVSFNYRLGSFGFFSHPALTRESPRASGNQGILDQIAALKWVQDNIGRFGGDPRNVTIFGESAGALDVGALMTTPLSQGLFHRAIAQSGPVVLLGDPATLVNAEKRGQAVAARWKVAADASLVTLRAIPTAAIVAAEPDYISSDYDDTFPNLGLVVDGYVFPKRPSQVFSSGTQQRVPLLLGSNAREQIPFTTAPADLRRAIEEFYGPLAGRASALYTGSPDPLHGTPAEQWSTDTSFRCATVAQARWHEAAGNPTFHYEFAHVPPERAAVGATHASELSHLFGTYPFGLFGVGPAARATDADARVSDLIQQYWTNFAKTGDPNGPGLPPWARFGRNAEYVEIGSSTATARQALRRPFCDLFLEHVERTIAN